MTFCGIEVDNPFFLAPMAGVTDAAFRTVCREHGASLCYTEMVSAKALCYGDRKSAALLEITNGHRPCIVQIFGSEPDIMARGARIALERSGAQAVDINMGCPVPKIYGNGEGSALMKKPELARDIVRAVRDAVSVPVTVKFRAGIDQSCITAPEFAREMQDAGADAVCIHGRTRVQMYSGESDRGVIAAVKRSVRIPVIASGDARGAYECRDILSQTGADYIMVARGAMGYPLVFEDCVSVFTGKTPPVHREARLIDIMRRHAALAAAHKGEVRAMLEMRKHGMWYLARFRGAKPLKGEMANIRALCDFLAICDRLETQGLHFKQPAGESENGTGSAGT